MSAPRPAALAYFATPGPLTDPGAHAARVRDLPEVLPDLCRVVQGLVVHPFLTHLYGLEPGAVRLDELETRHGADGTQRIAAGDRHRRRGAGRPHLRVRRRALLHRVPRGRHPARHDDGRAAAPTPPACQTVADCRAGLLAALPNPASATGKTRKTAKQLQALAKGAGRTLDRAAKATKPKKQKALYKSARKTLGKLRTAAKKADGEGRLGVSLAALEAALDALLDALLAAVPAA